jgi:hypothetical protein
MKKIFFILLLVCPLVVIAAKNNITLQMLRSSMNMPVGTTLVETQIGTAVSSADCPINSFSTQPESGFTLADLNINTDSKFYPDFIQLDFGLDSDKVTGQPGEYNYIFSVTNTCGETASAPFMLTLRNANT